MLASFYLILPVFGWGLMPIFANLLKSKPETQLLGTSISACLIGSISILIIRPELTFFTFIISFLSGVFWAMGQFLQFKAIKQSSVSQAMPLSNGTQLIFTTLISVVVLSEWQKNAEIILGTVGIFMVLAGILILNHQKKHPSERTKKNGGAVFFTICWSSLFLTCYVLISKFFQLQPEQIFFPQGMGMLSSSLVINFISNNHPLKNDQKGLFSNLITGVSWSIANIGMFLATNHFPVATTYAISQSAVIVSTLAGIFILKENINIDKSERIKISIGITLLMSGVLLLAQNQ